MRLDEINKIVEYIKEQTEHKGDIFININNNAIPIEWIEKKLNCCDNINAEIFVKALIRDWEKEK